MHERTDGRTFDTGFIRSTLSKSRAKNNQPDSAKNSAQFKELKTSYGLQGSLKVVTIFFIF